MITTPIVFVLGAGASIPYGFPSGRDLMFQIHRDAYEIVSALTSGRPPNASDSWHQQHPLKKLTQFADQLLDSQLPSVDLFIERRPEYDRLGRLLIAHALIPCERPRRVLRQRRHSPEPLGAPLGWLEYLYGHMTAPPDRFLAKNRVSFVTFNYDRVLEAFFFSAFQHSYGLNTPDALAMVHGMNIVHLYGALGIFSPYLLQEPVPGERAFHPECTDAAVEAAAAGIKIIPDVRGPSPEFAKAHQLLSSAEVICFLGFGYHSTNIARLLPDHVAEVIARTRTRTFTTRRGHNLFGSAFHLGAGERRRVEEQIGLELQLAPRDADCLACLQDFPLF